MTDAPTVDTKNTQPCRCTSSVAMYFPIAVAKYTLILCRGVEDEKGTTAQVGTAAEVVEEPAAAQLASPAVAVPAQKAADDGASDDKDINIVDDDGKWLRVLFLTRQSADCGHVGSLGCHPAVLIF
jgi:hypothetical protein